LLCSCYKYNPYSFSPYFRCWKSHFCEIDYVRWVRFPGLNDNFGLHPDRQVSICCRPSVLSIAGTKKALPQIPVHRELTNWMCM
jgi:hypothetical protein